MPDVEYADLWSSDMVGFLLGCSFSWEDLLRTRGLCPRQIQENKNVPMVTAAYIYMAYITYTRIGLNGLAAVQV